MGFDCGSWRMAASSVQIAEIRNKHNSSGAFVGTVKTNRGQTIPTCNRGLAIHGSVDSGNLLGDGRRIEHPSSAAGLRFL